MSDIQEALERADGETLDVEPGDSVILAAAYRELLNLIYDIGYCGVSMEHPALDYVEVQIDLETWDKVLEVIKRNL